MKKFFLVVLVITTFCKAWAQEFTTAIIQGVDLKKYEFFTVAIGEVMTGGDQAIDKDAFYKEIKVFIIREMEARGYKFSDSSAQLSASYLVETTVRTDIQNLGPLGQSPTTNPAMVNQSQVWSRDFQQGTLFISLDDIVKKGTVWSSEGTMDITRTRGGNLLEHAVKNAFRELPDKTKKEKKSKKKKE
ncbi:MAG: DUF4136 domain-containing protein [Cyclobacteriaceae bacterium]|nr:DUF4136 domain-containing protein [Cyclobacteriaceae bacterium]